MYVESLVPSRNAERVNIQREANLGTAMNQYAAEHAGLGEDGVNEHRGAARMGRTTSKMDRRWGRKHEEARHTRQKFLHPQDAYDHCFR